MDGRAAANKMQNAIYKAALDILTELGKDGNIWGNTHHIAQEISRTAAIILSTKWNEKGEQVKT